MTAILLPAPAGPERSRPAVALAQFQPEAQLNTPKVLALAEYRCILTPMDTTHLVALQTRLSHERAYFAADGSEIRKVWISQIEKEIAREREFLGITSDVPVMTDDEILAELSGE